MTYQPAQHKVLIESQPDQHFVGVRIVSEGGLDPYAYPPQLDELWV